jgi:hypothetical protein
VPLKSAVGHLGVTLGVRLPCVWIRTGLTVLAAFGSFTGGGARIARIG